MVILLLVKLWKTLPNCLEFRQRLYDLGHKIFSTRHLRQRVTECSHAREATEVLRVLGIRVRFGRQFVCGAIGVFSDPVEPPPGMISFVQTNQVLFNSIVPTSCNDRLGQ